MSVKICGHKISWQKPIKPYALIHTVSCVAALLFVTVVSAPSFAADIRYTAQFTQASSGGAGPCSPPHASSRMETHVSSKTAPVRAQRAAGPQISPAMALALALGVRNVSGPLEKTVRHAPLTPAAQKPAYPSMRQASLLPSCNGCVPARSNSIASSRLAMEK